MSEGKPLALQHPRPTRDLDEPAHGFWPGTVISDEDPDKEGKIQVRVDQFYGKADAAQKIEDADLPWALPGGFLAGADSGSPRTPAVGAGVWVGFWGGDREHPIWFGGYYGSGEAPAAFSSAYTPGPKTWLTKTAHGHFIEMRWVEGEEELHLETAGGIKLRLQDADALGGPKVLAELPSGRTLVIDDKTQLVKLAALAQSLEMLDASGALNLTATNTITLTATQLTLALATVSAAALAITAVGLLALTGAGVSIVSTAAAVAIGSAAASSAVVLASFLSKYDIHTHPVTTAPGTTGPPTPVSAPADLSQNVVVD